MSYALCHLSVVPVRNSSSDRSEQISQLLFGEAVEILDRKGKMWAKVRCTWDNCIGWVQARQIFPITSTEFKLFSEQFAYCLDLFQPLYCNERAMPITIGARLPDFDGLKFTLNGKTYFYSGQAVFPENLIAKQDKVLKIAQRYLNAPYQWGGRSPLGIDAPGFVQTVFKLVGISLPREASQQVFQGELIDFIELSLPGDIAFFENQLGNIVHVGLILHDKEIIHVAEQVRIDKLDHYGIFNSDLNSYTHRLRVIKRLLPAIAQPNNFKKEESKVNPNQVVMFD